MKEGKVAILIFANSAEKEAVSKPFQYSKDVFAALNARTLSIIKKTGLPYFIFSENQQVGNSFGERFTNAIQTTYNKGYNTVITIGNDTPHLTTKHILKTAHLLQKHNLVLGPSTDGGFYLMGLKKSQFNADIFLKLPWQTSQLNRSISKLNASKKINICYLETLTDIDSAADVKTIINNFRTLSKTIKKLLKLYLFLEKRIISTFYISIKNPILNLQFNKGSPITNHI
ncbi:hypothetical protein A8C32_15475 [Flavivirga aquatica]|uniref:DUF2064 domain-containing protein n=1 Tax=Flavivirga aquatica TaxID=1849968 RepID=A0A1E5T955_9FLAO|nr:DUF2064 domain-containing protein [Flavivirga aquatica]OEK07878.1 hypothetical protein A8C32_15475 [Flavivirga aquatica]